MAFPPRAGAALVAVVLAAGTARAEIKDYQIARMLNFRTDCGLTALKRVPPGKGEVERFVGECANRTFYPDGVEIGCPEENDEWACRVLTIRKSFDNLEMLRQEP